MSSAILIRLGGLLAIVGGLAATILGLLYVLQAGGMTLDFTAKAFRAGDYETPVATMLLIGVLAAIAALHFLQRRYYGRWGALHSLATFVGLTMYLVGTGVAYARGDFFLAFPATTFLVVVGVLAVTVGIVGLGIVTLSAGVLPRWCGIAIIAGSPPGVGILFLFFTPLGMAGILPGEFGWALAGIPWIVVGYAAFRAARRGTVSPTRVR